jgi:hypothetical protein
MKNHLKAVATCVLITAMATAHGQTTQPSSTTTGKRPVRHKTARTPARPSVESQIEQLRQDMETQINQLKQQLTDSNAQLQAAQQQAAAANATAAQAQQAAQQEAQQTAETSSAVTNLQGAVTDLKANSTSLASTIQDTQANILKKVDNPDAIHFKGITLSPTGSFLAAETTWRSKGVGADVNTPFSALPLDSQENAHLSEFYGSGRQSRIALLAEGKLSSNTLRGYYEADFLSAGVTSNNNQSNSYTLRQRQLWAQAALSNGWSFTGGQQWSLVTETRHGLDNRTEALPQTIDAQYNVGFNWERQYGFRVVKDFHDKFWLGVSAENPETLNVGGHGIPNNFVFGQAGAGGGLYNLNANYSYNLAPDLLAKIAIEPGWGHYEIWGVSRFFRDRIYPNLVTTTTAGVTTTSGSSAGAYNDSTVGGAVGGSLRVPTFHKHLDLGLKGAWGDGANRYNNTGLADLTVRPNGQFALIHGYSGLGTIEYHTTPRLDLYVNYGIDGVLRRVLINPTTHAQTGYGAYTNNEAGCATESIPAAGGNGVVPAGLPSTCVADTRDLQEFTVGYWYDFYKGPKGRFRQGVQYSYTQRQIFSGVGAPAPSGEDNLFFTSIRYYLP